MSKQPAVHNLFGDDSDDEGGPTTRPRSGAAGPATTAVEQPMDPEVREAADKLADFVAKNGRKYEDMTRERNPGNTTFKFLWNKSSRDYKYYEARLTALTQQQQQQQQQQALPPPPPAAAGPSVSGRSTGSDCNQRGPPSSSYPPPPGGRGRYDPFEAQRQNSNPHSGGSGSLSGRKRNRWDDKASSAPPPPAAPSNPSSIQAAAASAAAAAAAVAARLTQQAAAGGSSGSNAGAAAAGSSHTLSAMEQYMQRLAEQEAQKKREEEEEEAERKRRAAQPLLKETAFDRRKVVAVYKDDGERGHHMQDYIPKEELAKFMAKTGDDKLQRQVEAESSIGADNVGHKLLQKMGWQQGKGIGAKESGITAPVGPGAGAAAAGQNLGLGAEAHGAVKEDDDPFEQYRKRMMLGYKYRPNPLGNPRRQYY